MIKKHYSGSARRARNILWNAAGRYDFEPPFLAFFPNGAPDHYFNMIIGLAEKWFGLDRLYAFFEQYEGIRRADEFDAYLWLGLENCLYEKEIAERPVLKDLREERARRFFAEQANLSRQQMEYQSVPVYNQQEMRWASVLGRRLPLLSAREKKIAEALRFSGEWDLDETLRKMAAFLKEYFRYENDSAGRKPNHSKKAGPLSKLFLRHVQKQNDRLIIRTGTGEGDHERAVQLRHGAGKLHEGPTEADSLYIRSLFGRSCLNERDLYTLENNICTQEDADCRIWIASDASPKPETEDKEVLRALEDIRKQIQKNKTFFEEHASVVRHTVTDLSTRIETVLSSYLKHLPEPSRSGRIRPERAYRLPLLHDDRIFLKDGEETEPEICVDLLLDASMSRLNSQEAIACEAYIIAASFMKLHIPVRISQFRSLRGYTVTQIMKDWKDTDPRGVLGYFAGGWNRDSLALKSVAGLEDPCVTGKVRLLLIMTDASPNDTSPLAGEGLRLNREYEGSAAVKAAENAVRSIRKDGIRAGAVFHGNSGHLDDLHEIYGQSCVRIRKVTQLSQGVSDLMLMLLREVHP